MRPKEPPEAHPRRPGPSRESGNNAPAVRRGRAGSARERPRRRRPGPWRGSPQSWRDPSFHLVAWITPPEGATPATPRIHRQIANSAGVSTSETDPYASEAHVTSLDRRDNVNREEAAIPGEVRRWRAFALLAVAFFTGASLACALATSDTFLIIMRGIQGLGAAVVLPAALSIVMKMFSEGR